MGGADTQQTTPGATLSKAAGLPGIAGGHTDAEHTGSMLEEDESERDVEGAGMQEAEGEGAAFELPSQMPRELQSWAWDK